jgi:hypothetical protein
VPALLDAHPDTRATFAYEPLPGGPR